jgi:hypothetical protein
VSDHDHEAAPTDQPAANRLAIAMLTARAHGEEEALRRALREAIHDRPSSLLVMESLLAIIERLLDWQAAERRTTRAQLVEDLGIAFAAREDGEGEDRDG